MYNIDHKYILWRNITPLSRDLEISFHHLTVNHWIRPPCPIPLLFIWKVELFPWEKPKHRTRTAAERLGSEHSAKPGHHCLWDSPFIKHSWNISTRVHTPSKQKQRNCIGTIPFLLRNWSHIIIIREHESKDLGNSRYKLISSGTVVAITVAFTANKAWDLSIFQLPRPPNKSAFEDQTVKLQFNAAAKGVLWWHHLKSISCHFTEIYWFKQGLINKRVLKKVQGLLYLGICRMQEPMHINTCQHTKKCT